MRRFLPVFLSTTSASLETALWSARGGAYCLGCGTACAEMQARGMSLPVHQLDSRLARRAPRDSKCRVTESLPRSAPPPRCTKYVQYLDVARPVSILQYVFFSLSCVFSYLSLATPSFGVSFSFGRMIIPPHIRAIIMSYTSICLTYRGAVHEYTPARTRDRIDKPRAREYTLSALGAADQQRRCQTSHPLCPLFVCLYLMRVFWAPPRVRANY